MSRIYKVLSVQISLQKSNPPTILVVAQGLVPSSGWKNIDLVPLEDPVSADGILDLEFVGTPPTGISSPVILPVMGDYVIDKDVDRIVGVIIHSRTNSESVLLAEATNPGGPSTGVDRFMAPDAMANPGLGQVTTMAVGEEKLPWGEKLPWRHETFWRGPGESSPFAYEKDPISEFDRYVSTGPVENFPDPRDFQRSAFGQR